MFPGPTCAYLAIGLERALDSHTLYRDWLRVPVHEQYLAAWVSPRRTWRQEPSASVKSGENESFLSLMHDVCLGCGTFFRDQKHAPTFCMRKLLGGCPTELAVSTDGSGNR